MTSEKQANVFALVMAAGSGTRVGGEIPKQYRLIDTNSFIINVTFFNITLALEGQRR